jgi:hypothetical protein
MAEENNSNPVKWRFSKAKELLYNDIIGGLVMEDSDYRVVFTMRPEYQQYELVNFRCNLKNLLAAVRLKQGAADSDRSSFSNDVMVLNLRNQGRPAELQWNTSEAKLLLKADITMELHKHMKPIELWRHREVYQQFSLKTFRKHIYQETRSRIETSYWLEKQKQSKLKKQQQQQNKKK